MENLNELDSFINNSLKHFSNNEHNATITDFCKIALNRSLKAT